ncbi:polysaccharide deacetylase family protein [Bowmanella denitrificans]|uniref:Polysaccharide deacetylase family protein n=1 Tax=Bowmanella denitrificans TaxID=366582 RepID=A0ABP3GPG6_9ALTE
MNRILKGLMFAGAAICANLQAADQLAPSVAPPGGLIAQEVPMFVSFGFDDNGFSGDPAAGNGVGGMKWAIELFKNRTNPPGVGNPGTFDGMPARVTFFLTCGYATNITVESPYYVKKIWREAYTDGHEIGNHTMTHATGGRTRSEAGWQQQINDCQQFLSAPFDANEQPGAINPNSGIGVPVNQIKGFRTPFLEFNDNTFKAMQQAGFTYDSSIEEGWQFGQNGGQHNWPYTLDFGSPGNEVKVGWGNSEPISTYPGFWEIPVYPFIVPDDASAAAYGINYSLRDKAAAAVSWFDVNTGKITGFDYNLMYFYPFNKQELLAVFKHTLDVRLAGNRAPMMIGAHTDYYNDSNSPDAAMRREVIAEFVDYAMSKPEVRFVRYDQLLDWMRTPVALDPNGPVYYQVSAEVVAHEVPGNQCTEPAWSASSVYVGGSRVSHSNAIWQAKWWTQGDEPGAASWGPWNHIEACNGTVIEYYGSVSPASAVAVEEGQTQIFSFVPDSGYEVDYVEVNGIIQPHPGSSNSFTLGPVNADANLKVRFKQTTP